MQYTDVTTLLVLCQKLLCSSFSPCKIPSRVISLIHSVHKLKQTDETDAEKRVLLMSLKLFPSFVEKFQQDEILQDKVSAILVTDIEDLDFFSSDSSAPEGVLEQNGTVHRWNPNGNGLRFKYLPVPVFLLNHDIVHKALHGAHENHKRSFSGPLYNVETKMLMHAKNDSLHCLGILVCQPLGGYSILGITPEVQSSEPENKVILVSSKLDSAGFFLDRIIGADSSLASLIVMLSAIEILNQKSDFKQYKKQLAFIAFAGEPWDFMGSKRFLWELTKEQDSIFDQRKLPFNLTQLTQVIDLGQVGNPVKSEGNYRFYLHEVNSRKGASNELKRSLLETSREASNLQLSLQSASESNPGIPPSSLEVLLSFNSNLEGILIEEFDQNYSNPYYNSIKDDEDNLSLEPMIKISILVAQTLHKLAMEDNQLIQVNEDTVKQIITSLIGCLVKKQPGLQCELAQELMSVKPQSSSEITAADHYISVLGSVDSNVQDADINTKSNMERFVFNYMGARLGAINSTECDLNEQKCDANQVCVGYKALESKSKRHGKCYHSSVYFVPSYSLSLKYKRCNNGSESDCRPWTEDLDSDVKAFVLQNRWKEDPIWTESNWTTESQSLELSMVESKATETKILISGIILTLGTILISLIFQSLYNKRIKAA
eukprot:g2503.t1